MSILSRFQNSFIAGLIVAAPFVVTAIALEILSGWILRFVNPVVRETGLVRLTANIELLAQVVAALLIAAFIAFLGALTRWSVGRRLFGTADRAVNIIPLAGVIYSAVKGMANSMVSGGGDFDRVVLLEYPRDGVYSIGLVTSRTPEAARPFTDGPAYNIYLPGSPNPTAGRFLIVPESALIELDMSVREGIGLLVTTGVTGEDQAKELPDGVAGAVIEDP